MNALVCDQARFFFVPFLFFFLLVFLFFSLVLDCDLLRYPVKFTFDGEPPESATERKRLQFIKKRTISFLSFSSLALSKTIPIRDYWILFFFFRLTNTGIDRKLIRALKSIEHSWCMVTHSRKLIEIDMWYFEKSVLKEKKDTTPLLSIFVYFILFLFVISFTSLYITFLFPGVKKKKKECTLKRGFSCLRFVSLPDIVFNLIIILTGNLITYQFASNLCCLLFLTTTCYLLYDS